MAIRNADEGDVRIELVEVGLDLRIKQARVAMLGRNGQRHLHGWLLVLAMESARGDVAVAPGTQRRDLARSSSGMWQRMR